MEPATEPVMEPQVQLKSKNPKKQEAGRLGAIARKVKEQRLLEELTAARKEKVHGDEPPPTQNTHAPFEVSYIHIAIGLAVLAGVVMFKPARTVVVEPVRTVEAPLRQSESAPRSAFDL